MSVDDRDSMEAMRRDGWSDEEIERATGASLEDLLLLRFTAATAPSEPAKRNGPDR